MMFVAPPPPRRQNPWFWKKRLIKVHQQLKSSLHSVRGHAAVMLIFKAITSCSCIIFIEEDVCWAFKCSPSLNMYFPTRSYTWKIHSYSQFIGSMLSFILVGITNKFRVVLVFYRIVQYWNLSHFLFLEEMGTNVPTVASSVHLPWTTLHFNFNILDVIETFSFNLESLKKVFH